ncbi:BON domain-containing protein [Brunnivagina elsteri]|uniref:Transporter n=1 Tax=Brunnivagina elsteri CCALA 953 TaxID=987040 RepID=A0A2A2TLH7_9CYAN|nr:BON domain-containing protein [Calothrix elsteri]PAX58406.1 transporter [Calothrix elsteri CCALA 953]
MKKAIALFTSSILLISLVACTDAKKTSNVAPDSTKDNVEVPNAQEAQSSQEDATSETRRRQLNADIKAREQRNNGLNQGAAVNRANKDVASEVRSKLEANIPASALVVEAKDGIVTVTGSVPTQQQFNKITKLAQEIKGVKSVIVKAVIAPAKSTQNN